MKRLKEPDKASPVSQLVKRLYGIVGELEALFPGRKFTPDGHLVGSLGEVVAAQKYGLTLLPASTDVHDAVGPDGRKVQIKATQGRSVALSSRPDFLIVLRLRPDGGTEEIYNGPGGPPWKHCGPLQKNGQRRISFTALRKLLESVPTKDRIP